MSDDELENMAAGACQEALAFGVSEEAFMKLARSVRERCAKVCDDDADRLALAMANRRRGAQELARLAIACNQTVGLAQRIRGQIPTPAAQQGDAGCGA